MSITEGKSPLVCLNDGRKMPQLGLGVMFVPKDEVPALVRAGLENGFRAFDTSPYYANEGALGRALLGETKRREDFFFTTKLWNAFHGYDAALKAFDGSLERTGLDYVDLFLIHWPVTTQGLYIQTWKALVRLQQEGRARSIGVSNFLPHQLREIADATGVAPAVNQVELHPHWQQPDLQNCHREMGIATQCWSPLGQGAVLADPVIVRIAADRGRSPAAVVLRFLTQQGLLPVAKSSSGAHMVENLGCFDFMLDDDEIETLRALDRVDGRFGPDPWTFVSPPSPRELA